MINRRRADDQNYKDVTVTIPASEIAEMSTHVDWDDETMAEDDMWEMLVTAVNDRLLVALDIVTESDFSRGMLPGQPWVNGDDSLEQIGFSVDEYASETGYEGEFQETYRCYFGSDGYLDHVEWLS